MTDTPQLDIRSFTLGLWQTNCYLVAVEGDTECWIVDAGFEPRAMIEAIDEAGWTPTQVLLTHGHIDHIAGLEAIRERWADIPIAIHPGETQFLTEPDLNLSGPFGLPLTAPEATDTIEHGRTLTLGELAFEVRHTPGHSPGGVTLYQPDHHVAIVGDTLFAGGIGRFDFPTSDGGKLMRSIREQLLSLPDDTAVLPGHGPSTTIGDERRSNPYLRNR